MPCSHISQIRPFGRDCVLCLKPVLEFSRYANCWGARSALESHVRTWDRCQYVEHQRMLIYQPWRSWSEQERIGLLFVHCDIHCDAAYRLVIPVSPDRLTSSCGGSISSERAGAAATELLASADLQKPANLLIGLTLLKRKRSCMVPLKATSSK
jgi:hypothetical protein